MARKLAGDYKRLHTIIPESETEEEDQGDSSGLLCCKPSQSASAPSTALGLHLPFDSCASAEADLQSDTLDRSFQREAEALSGCLPIEPFFICEERDDTYNRAARAIQNMFKSRYFFRTIMKVVRQNREFKRDEERALRNRMRRLGAEASK